MDSRVIERVMRSGIEFRAGLSLDKIFDRAQAEVNATDKKRKVASSSQGFKTLEEWFNYDDGGLKFALLRANGKMECVCVNSISNLVLDGWSTIGSIPYVSLAN